MAHGESLMPLTTVVIDGGVSTTLNPLIQLGSNQVEWLTYQVMYLRLFYNLIFVLFI